jgi:hypothetical protein
MCWKEWKKKKKMCWKKKKNKYRKENNKTIRYNVLKKIYTDRNDDDDGYEKKCNYSK